MITTLRDAVVNILWEKNLKLLAISLLFIGCSEVPINPEEMVRQIKFCYDNDLEPVQLRGIGGRVFAVECRVK